MSDPYGAFVQLLLPMDGAGTTFTDLSNYKRIVTVFGDAAQSSGFGNFDGSGDCLRVPAISFGSLDFCIEALVKLSAMPTSDAWPGSWNSCMVVAGVGTTNMADGVDLVLGSTQIMFQSNDAKIAAGAHGMTTGVEYHVAAIRSGNNVSTFVNGVAKGSSTVSGAVGSGAYTWIGSETGQGAYLNGKIRRLRFTIGMSRYDSPFTPPNAPLDAPTPWPIFVGGRYDLDPRFGGQCRVADKVSRLGLPGPYRVRLYHRASGRLVREVWSDADGAYAFAGIRGGANAYFAVAHDDSASPVNAAIADLITPVAMS